MRACTGFLVVLPFLAVPGAVRAQALHFKVTGEYQAQTVIAFEETGGQATVTDKVVLEFDKDLKTGGIGPVSFQNFPSATKDLRNVERSCPPPSPKGPYEHLEVTAVTYGGYGSFEIKGKRSYPEVQVTAYCQGSWAKKTVKARQVAAVESLALIEGNEPTVFSIKLDNGWTWTYVTTRAGR